MSDIKYDVVALGELLIDFVEGGESTQKNPMFEANPGGAPCNVLAMLQKLGNRTAFIGKVGDDFFGHMLEKTILFIKQIHNINRTGVLKSRNFAISEISALFSLSDSVCDKRRIP